MKILTGSIILYAYRCIVFCTISITVLDCVLKNITQQPNENILNREKEQPNYFMSSQFTNIFCSKSLSK